MERSTGLTAIRDADCVYSIEDGPSGIDVLPHPDPDVICRSDKDGALGAGNVKILGPVLSRGPEWFQGSNILPFLFQLCHYRISLDGPLQGLVYVGSARA